MAKKCLLIVLILGILISCGFICTYMINYFFGMGGKRTHNLPTYYNASNYAYISENIEMKLSVDSDTVLLGWIKDDAQNINIRVEYENYGSAYEYDTAKIYDIDSGKCVDYVMIECNGKEIKLSKLKEDIYDPSITENINAEDSIFSLFGFNRIILEAIP